MITIHAGDAQDFSSLGMGVLLPEKCEIEEEAGGNYTLTMEHPMDGDGRWKLITQHAILKCDAPVRETPLVEIGHEATTVSREIYRVRVNTRLRLRTTPSSSS